MKSKTLITIAPLASLTAGAGRAIAQKVEKVADLNFASIDGVGSGGYAPLDRFTQVGTNLWFTTSRGGIFDAGTVSRFDLVTREVVQAASFDNNSGKASESSVLILGDAGYFTTVNGGSSNKGTIARISLAILAGFAVWLVVRRELAVTGIPGLLMVGLAGIYGLVVVCLLPKAA